MGSVGLRECLRMLERTLELDVTVIFLSNFAAGKKVDKRTFLEEKHPETLGMVNNGELLGRATNNQLIIHLNLEVAMGALHKRNPS